MEIRCILAYCKDKKKTLACTVLCPCINVEEIWLVFPPVSLWR